MLIGIARFSCIVGLIERPLALSLVVAFATGLWDVALPLGISLELMWLDVVAMGSIIQPFGGMAFLLLFPLSATLSWTQPGVLLLPLVLCMVAAHVGAFCELRYRIHQNHLLDCCTRHLRALPAEGDAAIDPATSRYTPECLLSRCLKGRIVWHALLYLVCYAILCLVVSTLLLWDLYPVLPNLDWVFIYAMAIIGAVLSLRERRAYVVCGLTILAIVALLIGGEIMALES